MFVWCRHLFGIGFLLPVDFVRRVGAGHYETRPNGFSSRRAVWSTRMTTLPGAGGRIVVHGRLLAGRLWQVGWPGPGRRRAWRASCGRDWSLAAFVAGLKVGEDLPRRAHAVLPAPGQVDAALGRRGDGLRALVVIA